MDVHSNWHLLEGRLQERYHGNSGFFKRVQQDKEGIAECLAELRKLGKSCNFGNYLDMALQDQLVCGLKDQKTKKELLSIQELMLAMAIEKARAAEAVNREILYFPEEADALKLYDQQKLCHRCGLYMATQELSAYIKINVVMCARS